MNFYPSRLKLALLFLGSCVFVALGFWLIHDVGSWTVGSLAITFFGLCALYAFYRLVWLRPLLRVDAEGLLDSSNFFSAGLIGWNDISEVRVYSFKNQCFIGIKTTSNFRNRCGKRVRAAIRMNEWFGCMPINIPTNSLKGSVEEITAAIGMYHQNVIVPQ